MAQNFSSTYFELGYWVTFDCFVCRSFL